MERLKMIRWRIKWWLQEHTNDLFCVGLFALIAALGCVGYVAAMYINPYGSWITGIIIGSVDIVTILPAIFYKPRRYHDDPYNPFDANVVVGLFGIMINTAFYLIVFGVMRALWIGAMARTAHHDGLLSLAMLTASLICTLLVIAVVPIAFLLVRGWVFRLRRRIVCM